MTTVQTDIQKDIDAMLAASGFTAGADIREGFRDKLQALPAIVRNIRSYAYGETPPTIARAVADVLYNFDSNNRRRVAVALALEYDILIALLSGYVMGTGD